MYLMKINQHLLTLLSQSRSQFGLSVLLGSLLLPSVLLLLPSVLVLCSHSLLLSSLLIPQSVLRGSLLLPPSHDSAASSSLLYVEGSFVFPSPLILHSWPLLWQGTEIYTYLVIQEMTGGAKKISRHFWSLWLSLRLLFPPQPDCLSKTTELKKKKIYIYIYIYIFPPWTHFISNSLYPTGWVFKF
jgi:hypothetical protein